MAVKLVLNSSHSTEYILSWIDRMYKHGAINKDGVLKLGKGRTTIGALQTQFDLDEVMASVVIAYWSNRQHDIEGTCP